MSENKAPLFEIDVARLRDLTRIGARRTAAFLAIGSSRHPAGEYKDFSLGSKNRQFRYWPEPLTIEIAEKSVEEFDSWLLSACLRDLHLHFEIFLDTIWEFAKMVSEHGSAIPSNYIMWDELFRRQTSVSGKYSKLVDLLGSGGGRAEHFKTFHSVRNCLTHNAGYVRSSDCVGADIFLELKWIGQAIFLRDGHYEIEIQEAIDSEYVTKNQSAIILKSVERSVKYEVMDRITIEQRQLAEISWFYVSSADIITDSFVRLITSKQT